MSRSVILHKHWLQLSCRDGGLQYRALHTDGDKSVWRYSQLYRCDHLRAASALQSICVIKCAEFSPVNFAERQNHWLYRLLKRFSVHALLWQYPKITKRTRKCQNNPTPVFLLLLGNQGDIFTSHSPLFKLLETCQGFCLTLSLILSESWQSSCLVSHLE